MKAVLEGRMIAESDDIIEGGGYDCVPAAAVRPEPLRQAPRAADDLDFLYGVQFSDLVIDGVRHPCATWSYEAPAMRRTGGRFGFRRAVEVRPAAGYEDALRNPVLS